MTKPYRWFAVPMGVMGLLLMTQGWAAVIFGLIYGLLCVGFTVCALEEMDRQRQERGF